MTQRRLGPRSIIVYLILIFHASATWSNIHPSCGTFEHAVTCCRKIVFEQIHTYDSIAFANAFQFIETVDYGAYEIEVGGQHQEFVWFDCKVSLSLSVIKPKPDDLNQAEYAQKVNNVHDLDRSRQIMPCAPGYRAWSDKEYGGRSGGCRRQPRSPIKQISASSSFKEFVREAPEYMSGSSCGDLRSYHSLGRVSVNGLFAKASLSYKKNKHV